MCRGLTGFDQYSAWPWSPRRPFAASACAKLIAARWAGRAAWGRRKHTNSTIHAGVQSDNRDNGSFPSCEPRHLNNSRWDVSFGPRLKSPAERRSVFLTKLIEVSPDVEGRQQSARARQAERILRAGDRFDPTGLFGPRDCLGSATFSVCCPVMRATTIGAEHTCP